MSLDTAVDRLLTYLSCSDDAGLVGTELAVNALQEMDKRQAGNQRLRKMCAP